MEQAWEEARVRPAPSRAAASERSTDRKRCKRGSPPARQRKLLLKELSEPGPTRALSADEPQQNGDPAVFDLQKKFHEVVPFYCLFSIQPRDDEQKKKKDVLQT